MGLKHHTNKALNRIFRQATNIFRNRARNNIGCLLPDIIRDMMYK